LIYVPASWNEQNPDWDGYGGVAWYQYDFHIPREFSGLTAWLVFEGVGYLTRAWFNGLPIGGHEGSFTQFRLKVNGVRFGDWNRVVVKVDNNSKSRPLGRGYPTTWGFSDTFINPDFTRVLVLGVVPPGGGFPPLDEPVGRYPTVSTTPRTKPLTPKEGVTPKTPTVKPHPKGGKGVITRHDGYLKVEVESNCGKTHNIALELIDSGGSTVYSRVVESRGLVAVEDRVKVEPWSIEHPVLYRLTVKLLVNGEEYDEVMERVGFRTFEVRPSGFYLNGESIFLKGFGRHEDFPIFGRSLPGPVLVRDFHELKGINANSFRTSHYPYSNQHLDLADEFGILVILEAPLVGLREQHFKDQAYLAKAKAVIGEMVRQHRNRPSVVMYSVANEPNSIVDEARVFLGELISHVKSIDPTRPVIYTSHRHLEDKALGLGDAIALNTYFGWYSETGDIEAGVARVTKLVDEVHARYPDKPIIVTEFGAEGYPGLHHDPPVAWSEEYQELFIRRYIEELSKKPYVRGLHIWNYADFRTPQNTRRVILNTKGVFTRDRRPKLAVRAIRELFAGLR
jgi:beta-glucuronidase